MRLLVYVDHFPALSETFVVEEVAALRRLGHEVRVETAGHPRARARLEDPPRVDCLDDDPQGRRLRDLAWLVARRPRAVLADLRARRRWAREEQVRPLRVLAPLIRRLHAGGERHVHVHFAAGAALDALRIKRLAATTYSVTAHAYEIYRRPANLPEKLRGAVLAAGVADATVADLRALAPGARVEKVAMGVDAARFRRSAPYPCGRHVVAVGRLVPKKGFAHLIEAVAILRDRGTPLERVTIVGDGPLRGELEGAIQARGLADTVVLAGERQPAEVPALLEAADVLAVPSVVAPDGDRDALPVVVQEALAMEVPVVASDLVGLPEVVRPQWGRLAPPGDPEALADALHDLLAQDRVAMGRAARRFAQDERDAARWAARLVELLQMTGVR